MAWSYFNDSFIITPASTGCVPLRRRSSFMRRLALPSDAPRVLTRRNRRLCSSSLTVDPTGIAFKADLKTRFASKVAPAHFNDVPGLRGGGTLQDANGNAATALAQDERFVTWMRTPALSDFRKLWGRIDTTIEAGETLQVAVLNNWNSYGFGGKKRIVLSTSTWLGGRNHFLGVAYLVVGGVCLLLAAVFALLVALKGRRLADPKYYSWNRPHAQ